MNKRLAIGVFGMLAIMLIILSALNTGDFSAFFDLRSFLFVFGIGAIATVITTNNVKQRIKIFSRVAVSSGWIGFVIGLILIMGDQDLIEDFRAIFPAISVALLPIFYGYTVKLFVGIWLKVMKIKDL